MKIALEITPNLEPLFGTRDENLRLMEDSLGVRIDLRSDAVLVEGPDEGVAKVRGIFQDFESLRRQGIHPHNGELNGMLRLVVAEAQTTLRSLADSGKQRSAGIKRTVQPRSINQRKYGAWMGFEHNGYSLVDVARLDWDGLFQHPALGRNTVHNMEYHRPLDLLRQRLG